MNENKKDTKEIIKYIVKGCLFIILITIGLIILIIIAVFIADRIPKTVASDKYDTYTVELQSKGSPFMFSPQDARIILKNNSKKICKADFTIYNDGKSIDEGNWNIVWNTDKVTITIKGEEQKDDVWNLYYNGKVENKY